ncbi:unnamed protein product [Protopolystoma xenopodis]|uniref:Uncharacterized protein n=1 Tax=Protopolystoma xenopodis TaxID=117903 RepID=A0A3S5A9M6_9PLAT|nr:unnamed protein product [Protopolystoma xenopodis]
MFGANVEDAGGMRFLGPEIKSRLNASLLCFKFAYPPVSFSRWRYPSTVDINYVCSANLRNKGSGHSAVNMSVSRPEYHGFKSL